MFKKIIVQMFCSDRQEIGGELTVRATTETYGRYCSSQSYRVCVFTEQRSSRTFPPATTVKFNDFARWKALHASTIPSERWRNWVKGDWPPPLNMTRDRRAYSETQITFQFLSRGDLLIDIAENSSRASLYSWSTCKHIRLFSRN